MSEAPINPWIEPEVPHIRDAKQTFIVRGFSPLGSYLSKEYGRTLADLSLVDITALAREGRTLILHYEEGYRSTFKPIPTLEISNVNAPKAGASESEETLPS